MQTGFIRDSAGKITTFSAPGDVNGTIVTAINNHGAVAGAYGPSTTTNQAFLRRSNGKFREFDPPGAVPPGTIALHLSPVTSPLDAVRTTIVMEGKAKYASDEFSTAIDRDQYLNTRG